MPNGRTALIARIDGNEGFIIEIKLNHSKGGLNHNDDKREPAGFYVHVNPATAGNGFVSFVLGSGIKTLVEPAPEFNSDRLATIAEKRSGIPGLERIYRKVIAGYPERGYPTWDEVCEVTMGELIER